MHQFFFLLFFFNRGFKEGFDQGVQEGRRIGWQEGFQQGCLEGEKLGSRIGCLLVPLLTILNHPSCPASATAVSNSGDFKTAAREIIQALSGISLRNEEDPEGRRDSLLGHLEAKAKALVANFSKQHPNLTEDERKRLQALRRDDNKARDLFF